MNASSAPARALVALALVAGTVSCKHSSAPPPEPEPEPEAPTPPWQILASEMPNALLSVSGRSASDVWAVGADKGSGPLVLHFDGKGWQSLHTGQSGDLWWVQAIAGGPVLMGGAGGLVLRYEHERFARVPTPAVAGQTVYGVWGKSGDDFYAVGNVGGKKGFLWHLRGGVAQAEALPRHARVDGGADGGVGGDAPGLFKVWGEGDEVWVVGAEGTVLYRKGDAPFALVPSGTKETLFTVAGTGGRVLAVGGGNNGIVLEGRGGVLRDVSPPGAPLFQGVFATEANGDWVSGARAMVYARSGGGAFAGLDHGLVLPVQSSLHSIYVDPTGGVWSAGGNVLTTALDGGMLIHFGSAVPTVILEDDHAAAPALPEAGAAVDGGEACRKIPIDVGGTSRQQTFEGRVELATGHDPEQGDGTFPVLVTDDPVCVGYKLAPQRELLVMVGGGREKRDAFATQWKGKRVRVTGDVRSLDIYIHPLRSLLLFVMQAEPLP
jgi:hypothetical protein